MSWPLTLASGVTTATLAILDQDPGDLLGQQGQLTGAVPVEVGIGGRDAGRQEVASSCSR
jgi:hypothetical protein